MNRIGIPIEKRRKIVEDVYSFLGRITLKPIVFKFALGKIKEKNLFGEHADRTLRDYLNMPYVSQDQESILEPWAIFWLLFD